MSYFSIIIPIYKIPEGYLRKCLESIRLQSFKDFEVILVDDESPDNCGKICDEYDEKYQNFFVLHQKNQGVSVARNNGLKKAKGKWIVFIDGDDWVEENYLEVFYNMINKKEADIYISSCYVNYSKIQVHNPFFKNKEIIFEKEGKDRAILQFLCSRIYGDHLGTADVGAPWAKVYRRSFLMKYNLQFEQRLLRMQDNVFNLFAFEHADRIYYLDLPIYHYRKSRYSGFSRFNKNIVQYYEHVFNIIENFIVDYKKTELFEQALNIKKIKSFYVYFKMYYFNQENTNNIWKLKSEIHSKLSEKKYKDALRNYESKYLDNTEKIFALFLKYKIISGLWLLMKGKDIMYRLLRRNI